MKLREYSVNTNTNTNNSSNINKLSNPTSPNGNTNSNTSNSSNTAGFIVQDVTEVYCKNSNDVYNVINQGMYMCVLGI